MSQSHVAPTSRFVGTLSPAHGVTIVSFMDHVEIHDRDDEWAVLAGTKRSQAAMMTIAPGGTEGGPRNEHEGADQWLYVIAGRGVATVGRKKIPLAPGTLLLIEAGEKHEIRNDGNRPLKTINVYAPPEFDETGEELR